LVNQSVGSLNSQDPTVRLISPLKQEQETRDEHAMVIVDYLHRQGGFAAVHDKTDPATIRQLLGMSKKSFKKAIGGLYKQRVINISDEGISLNNLKREST